MSNNLIIKWILGYNKLKTHEKRRTLTIDNYWISILLTFCIINSMNETNKQWHACIYIYTVSNIDGKTYVNYLVKVHI